jgi:hypothetical protein
LVDDVENVNLFTVVERGSAAFDGLRKNGELSKDMFSSIQTFANDVETVSGSFRGFKPEDFRSVKSLAKLREAAKSTWRCLRLSGLIKAFAEQVGELIKWMISLFQVASQKLGAVWGALANAKNVLVACLDDVLESMRLCETSKEKIILLTNTSEEICNHLRNVCKIGTHGPKKAMKSLLELADGDEILLCIELGTNIDDMFADCINHVIGTIERVDRAISEMPEVLKQDMPKIASVGDENDESDTIDFEDYHGGDSGNECEPIIRSRAASATNRQARIKNIVRALENMTENIESSSALTVLQKSAEGFEGVHEAVGSCGILIENSRSYAQNCKASIDAFNHGEWNVGVATKHILEVFALRDTGLAMKILAESILELVRANVALMRAVRERTKALNSGDGGAGAAIGEMVASLASDVDVDDLKGLGKAFGSLFR